MPMLAYMKIVGAKSGAIKGGVTQKGREGTIQVVGFSHEITVPRNAQSGLPTGQRMHKPLIVTKELDQSTPLLYGVLRNNENLTSVTINFYTATLKTASGMSSSVQHYTIKLTDASIAAIDALMAEDSHAQTTKGDATEKISFTYQAIEWTWTDGGITAQDDWEARV